MAEAFHVHGDISIERKYTGQLRWAVPHKHDVPQLQQRTIVTEYHSDFDKSIQREEWIAVPVVQEPYAK